ncbi:ribosomal protein S18 acetylase RimI-like enzyme [Herbaspirillum sp. Sphag1AN]|uniref:GNAT family N-acetyltransferase n=1 Tax=unclassified Herbaspirillum TaxID=2624150 RepID=UPI0016187F95|nr:ribosomal protein S18 acetylase RimI-like enzyme [Herbaspirillum sp. Sphag1AN]MBB3247058.1 ribosomal protein S18 acetylase RimI-like enzyme [Herbaspirillum sp. Sphag64]
MQNQVTLSAEQNPQFTLRTMHPDDLEACHRLSLACKWPHRLADWQFIAPLGQGLVIDGGNSGHAAGASVVDGPVIAGSGLIWPYGDTHASLGMIIVMSTLQGLGLGRKLMTRLLEQAGNRSVLLNATAAGQPLYEKLGFQATGKLHQHQGSIVQAPFVPLPTGLRMRPLGVNDTARLQALDRRASGLDRGHVIAALSEVAEGVALDSDGEMLGFALVRRFGHGHAIGPVVAPSAEHAKALISYWLHRYAGSFTRIDVTEESELSPWLSEIGLTRVDTVVSMCKGSLPQTDPAIRLFSVINQALG